MYWSVFGLYAAFVAEIATRLPVRTMFTSAWTFFIILLISSLATMLVGQIIFFAYKKNWQKISGAYTDGNA
jgi:zinc transporter ZupT